MKNEKLLAKLNEALHAKYDAERIDMLGRLISTVEDEIRTEAAKESGRGDTMKLATDILKVAYKGDKAALKFAYTDSDGYQYICDEHRLLKLSKSLPLPELLERITPVRYSNILKAYEGSDPVDLETPDIAKLQAYIKINKAARIKPILYDFGEGLPVVNAEWLLTMMKAFPDSVVKNGWSSRSIWFVAKNGDIGLMMGCYAMAERKKTEL